MEEHIMSKFIVSSGTVQPVIYRSEPYCMIHYGRAEYSVDRPVLSESLREQGQAICDALNDGSMTLDEAKKKLARIYF